MRTKRIVILGCSGSGKSTLAAMLARRLELPYAPSDQAYWTGDWSPTPADQVRRWADAVTAGDRWVFDGNFDAERDLVWGRAELAVWLDLPFAVTLWRVARRNLAWWISREAIWGGQRMTLAKAWSGLRHAGRSHPRKRAGYPALLAEFPHLDQVRITSSRQLTAWLASLQPD